MTTRTSHPRRFAPGTTGWTEDDLNDPAIEPIWDRGGYEIVEGVLTPWQLQRHADIDAKRKGRKGVKFGRLRVPPELVIESLSLDHEDHDQVTKREWYRVFGIPHYWLLDPFRRTLECLRLERGEYKTEASGRDSDEVTPCLFPGLTIQLAPI